MHKNNMCVIYDSDASYAMQLMNVINNNKNVPFGAQVFTEKSQLVSYLQDYEPKVLMISEDMDSYNIPNNDTRAIVLCNEETGVKKTKEIYGERAIGVYKYQSSNSILQHVIGQEIYKDIDSRVRISAISGHDPCRRNILSIAMAYVLGKKEPALYLNLDEFSGLEHILPDTKNSNLSDAFYMFKQNGYKYCDAIRQTINHIEQIDYIAPVQCAEDISYMDSGKLIQFIKGISEELGYREVVIDVSSGVKSSWNIFEGCDLIFVPRSDNSWIERKESAMEKYLLQMGMGHLADKITRVDVNIEQSQFQGDFWSKLMFSSITQTVERIVNDFTLNER